MKYEYRVTAQSFKNEREVEELLNRMAADGWEHYQWSALGPIPSLWLYFRREAK